jgi:hypothetical protein
MYPHRRRYSGVSKSFTLAPDVEKPLVSVTVAVSESAIIQPFCFTSSPPHRGA